MAGEILKPFPWIVLRVYLSNLESNIVGRWDIFERQLPPPDTRDTSDQWLARYTDGSPPAASRVLRLLFLPLFEIERAKPLRWVVLALAISASGLAAAQCLSQRLAKDPPARSKRWGALLGLATWSAYLILLAGTTAHQGSRILCPIHPALVVLALACLVVAIDRHRRDPSTVPGVDRADEATGGCRTV